MTGCGRFGKCCDRLVYPAGELCIKDWGLVQQVNTLSNLQNKCNATSGFLFVIGLCVWVRLGGCGLWGVILCICVVNW